MDVGVERGGQHEVELVHERGVAARLLEHRVDQHGLARARIPEQVRVRRRLRVEQLAEDQHLGPSLVVTVRRHARSASTAGEHTCWIL
jgi:hypothetical protein